MQKDHRDTSTKPQWPRVIAISSGKGGVGKSSISINLGISLAKQSAKVCVLDADTGLANANILLGLTPKFSLEHVLYGAKSIEEVMLDGPHGMKIIPGANGISECVSLHPRQQLRLTRELARVENEFDFLLIDTAAGISTTTLDFVTAAQHALIIITPEPTSLTDAFSLIKLLKRRSNRLHYHIMVNMCTGANQAKDVYHRFCSAIEKYVEVKCHYLGFVLRDESMRAAVVLQNPVAMFPNDDPSCRRFLRLADTLDRSTAALPTLSSFSGYWHRQFKRQRIMGGAGASTVPDSESGMPESLSLDQREQTYLSEISARVQLLIEQGKVDEEAIKQLLQKAVDAFIKKNNALPIDILAFVDFLVQSPERNDLLLRDIQERVKHWGGVAPPPCVDEQIDVDGASYLDSTTDIYLTEKMTSPTGDKTQALNILEPINRNPLQESFQLTKKTVDTASKETAATEVEVEQNFCIRTHQYDDKRFGSQDGLIEIIKRGSDSDQPLSKMLETLL